jgi:hypothetical protein
VEGDGARQLTVYASWNGATTLARWRVLGGDSPNQLRPLATAATTGFETGITVPTQRYVQVQALDSTGAAIGTSATVNG